KRNKFLEKESLMTRINEACNSLYVISETLCLILQNVLPSGSTKKDYKEKTLSKSCENEQRWCKCGFKGFVTNVCINSSTARAQNNLS
ncbi:hypothetical protein CLU79DRAFT_713120, partial [Phycomyces nitens]